MGTTVDLLPANLLGFLNLGPAEMFIVLIVGLLIFGRRFPEVGRSVGKTLLEFRRGLNKLKNEVHLDEEIGETKRALNDLSQEVNSSARSAIEEWTREEEEEEDEGLGADLPQEETLEGTTAGTELPEDSAAGGSQESSPGVAPRSDESPPPGESEERPDSSPAASD